jgi:hypothetical protein
MSRAVSLLPLCVSNGMLWGNLYLYIPDNCKLKGYIVLSKYDYSKTQWGKADTKGKNCKSQNPVRSLYRLQNQTYEIPAYTSTDVQNNILCEFKNLESVTVSHHLGLKNTAARWPVASATLLLSASCLAFKT